MKKGLQDATSTNAPAEPAQSISFDVGHPYSRRFGKFQDGRERWRPTAPPDGSRTELPHCSFAPFRMSPPGVDFARLLRQSVTLLAAATAEESTTLAFAGSHEAFLECDSPLPLSAPREINLSKPPADL